MRTFDQLRKLSVFAALLWCGALTLPFHVFAQQTSGLIPSTALAREALVNLSGTYASTAAEPWYGAWGTREFSFQEGRWSLKFVFALDPKMERPVFAFRTHGTYYLGVQNKSVPNAFNALFTEDAKFVTLLTSERELANKFRFANCGLVANQEKDISIDGCANWKPVMQCGQDHDLLALTSTGGVQFGVRPMNNDMCTADKRPSALLQPVSKR